jgi:hypothetical protein
MRGRLGRCVGLWERVGGAEDRVSHENLVARQLEQQLWLFPCRWVGWTKKLQDTLSQDHQLSLPDPQYTRLQLQFIAPNRPSTAFISHGHLFEHPVPQRFPRGCTKRFSLFEK